jgi:hypothetical protein
MEMKKLFAVGVIFLFIGVAVAPSINSTVVKASNDNALVEVTSQACGIPGFGNTTVKLTKEQYHDLEQYLVDFRARLNQTTTREEAIPLFKDAVVELNKYGLLPKGMSIEQAKKLISGPQLLSNQIEHIEGLLKNTRIGRLMIVHNLFCFIYAHTSFYWCNVNLVALSGGLLITIGLFLMFVGNGGRITDLGMSLFGFGYSLFSYSQNKPFIPVNIFIELEKANYSSFGLLGVVQGSYDVAFLAFTGFVIINETEKNYIGWAGAIYTEK